MKTSAYFNKMYYCPACKHQENHGTNHYGEIYCLCKRCGNSPLYCRDVDEFKDSELKEVTLHCYYYDISKYEESIQYRNFEKDMRGLGYEIFQTASMDGKQFVFKQYHLQKIKLYLPFQWDNQYVSNIGRVFNWREMVYENKSIKEGYFLEKIS